MKSLQSYGLHPHAVLLIYRNISTATQNSPCDSNLYETTPPRWSLFQHSASGKFLDTEQSDVDPVGNVLLLLQGEQGQVLRGQAHPSSGEWKDVRDALPLHGLECSPISVAAGEPLCAGSAHFPLHSPANADITVDRMLPADYH